VPWKRPRRRTPNRPRWELAKILYILWLSDYLMIILCGMMCK
jgi:hypothetical protein